MKKLLTFAVGLGLVFTIAGTASAMGTVDAPSDWSNGSLANGVVNSRHNLGSSGMHFNTSNRTTMQQDNDLTGGGGTSEVCIFCHTPHHGSTNAPLWNKGEQTTSYIAYGSTVGGSFVANGDIGAATLACLSCHDGVNTFDVIVNWPGKGSKGSNDSATSTNMNWNFYEGGGSDVEEGQMGMSMMTIRLNLGTDLTNDHPVSIDYKGAAGDDYSGSRASLRASTTVISDVSMLGGSLTASVCSTSDTCAENLWAVGGYVDAEATISDILRSGRVECSTCHDPHFKNTSWNEVAATWDKGNYVEGTKKMDGLFLRRIGGNSLSGVCRTCHAK